jgi:hypothetical protein
LIFILAVTTLACTDNATKLAYAIGRAADELHDSADGSTSEIDYVPKTGADRPYLILILPQRNTTLSKVISAGVSKIQATEIFSELAYLNIERGGILVVSQSGQRVTFTSYWMRYAQVDEIIHWSGTGPATLQLTKSEGHIKITGIE